MAIENRNKSYEKNRIFLYLSLSSHFHDQDPRSLNEWLVASKYEMLNVILSWGHLLIFFIIKNYEDDVHKTKQGPASLSRSKFFSTEIKYNKLSPYFDAFTDDLSFSKRLEE